jgi:hypothetical protein
MFGKFALVIGTDAGSFTAQNFFPDGQEFLQIVDILVIGLGFVLAKKTFHI